jgi:hypothetical protein
LHIPKPCGGRSAEKGKIYARVLEAGIIENFLKKGSK